MWSKRMFAGKGYVWKWIHNNVIQKDLSDDMWAFWTRMDPTETELVRRFAVKMYGSG